MKYTLLTTAAVLAMGIAPALAEDGHVPQSTLSDIGLSGMTMMSEAEGTTVRGAFSYATTSGSSLVIGVLNDGDGNSFVATANNSNSAGGAHIFLPSISASGGGSSAGGVLNTPGGGSFFGGAGGGGFAFAF